MAVNQPNFELSNSYNFLFRIIQVLKIKSKKKKKKIRFSDLYLKSYTKHRNVESLWKYLVICSTATKRELQYCFYEHYQEFGKDARDFEDLTTGAPVGLSLRLS